MNRTPQSLALTMKDAAKLVRVICADANPAGPGVQLEPGASTGLRDIAMAAPGHVDQGSFARVETKGRLKALTCFSIVATIWPTRLGRSIQPILGWYDESLPEIADWQIQWAAEHGVSFFGGGWYWSQGGRSLEHWLHGAYLNSRYREYLKFCLLWASHNRQNLRYSR